MEHFAIHLRCSSLPSPPLHLSYGSKRYEDTIARGSKFHLKFNHATLSFPQFTSSHQFARSFRHANCMINNSFSVPNSSKNIEGSDNKILRGMSGVSLLLGCILGIFNFSSMMNSKYNMAYAFEPPKMIIAGGENSFDSLWKTINAEGVETNPKFDPHHASVDDKKMYAVYLRKCGKKDEVVNMVKELEKEYKKSKDDPDTTKLFLRKALFELLLIQGNFDEARMLLDKEIDSMLIENENDQHYSKLFYRGSMIKVNYVEKIRKLLEIYHNVETTNPEKQPIADIFLYKAIIHTKLKDKEAAKWWEAFAKTLLTDE